MAVDINQLAQIGSMAATGGTAQAALGTAQTIYGLTQLPRARAEFERARAAAPSLETPSQFYENYKNAYDATLAGMERDAIQANLATSVQALQGAGGRALVGGLSQATAQSQLAQNRMLAQERQMRFQAGQALAGAEERSIARKETRSQRDQAYANQAYQAALGNIGGGLSAVGTGLMYSGGLKGDGKLGEKASNLVGKAEEKIGEKISDMRDARKVRKFGDFVQESRGMIDAANKPSYMQTPELNMPSLTQTFMQNRPLGFGEKPLSTIEPKQVKTVDLTSGIPAASLQPVNMPTPVPTRYEPMGSPIPMEFRNEQAIRQLDVLAQGYNQAIPALNIFNQTNPFKHGGMMTNGDFSHDRNPIDIVQGGAKVGEMTGGEYIINPTQAKKIASQSTYARKLFKRFERNAKKNK
jgi:hypothetical protein|tara:strand:- start:14899 stop:16134 length:1236 start_codon:yes stop_codon:yes gene_type:complete